MIRAILIDDEPLARMVVREYLLAYPANRGFAGVRRWF